MRESDECVSVNDVFFFVCLHKSRALSQCSRCLPARSLDVPCATSFLELEQGIVSVPRVRERARGGECAPLTRDPALTNPPHTPHTLLRRHTLLFPTAARAATASMTPAAPSRGGLTVYRVPCLSDNYAWLLVDGATGTTAIVDPSEADPVAAAVDAQLSEGWCACVCARAGWRERQTPTGRAFLTLPHPLSPPPPLLLFPPDSGGRLDLILNTHHHLDHTGGNLALKSKYGASIIGPAADKARIPGIDVALADGEPLAVGAATGVCLDTPGHTRGHVSFHFLDAGALFCGDTLFALGCGRLFEGDPPTMWASLSKLAALPRDTRVFCAHEYTQSNARWARAVDPGNAALAARAAAIDAARAAGEPTVPSLLGEELDTNPFLRPGDPGVRAGAGVGADADDVAAFAAVRAHKDKF